MSGWHNLPVELIRMIVEQMLNTIGPWKILNLKRVCRAFNNEIQTVIEHAPPDQLFRDIMDLKDQAPLFIRVPHKFSEKHLRARLRIDRSDDNDLVSEVRKTALYLHELSTEMEDSELSLSEILDKLCHLAIESQWLNYADAISTAARPGQMHREYRLSLHRLPAAAYLGNVELLQMVLKTEKANINAQSHYFGFALPIAARSQNFSMFELLVNNGASLEAGTIEMASFPNIMAPGNALQAACAHGHLDMAWCIIQKLETDLKLKRGNKDAAKHKLQANVELAMLKAINCCHVHVARFLLGWLESSENCKPACRYGGLYERALDLATQRGDLEMAQLFVIRQTNINDRSWHRGFYTALEIAVSHRQEDILDLLVAHGALVQDGSRHQSSVSLCIAAYNGDVWIMQKLLDQLDFGAEILNVGCPFFVTFGARPCNIAIARKHVRIFQLLIDKGATFDGSYLHFVARNSIDGVYQFQQTAPWREWDFPRR